MQCAVRAVEVTCATYSGQHSLEVVAVEDQHPVEDFSTRRCRSLVRRSRSRGVLGPGWMRMPLLVNTA
jgi:hypothetical protein